MPKIVAGVPSSGAGMKGGVNKLPGNVRLWKLTISIWSCEEAGGGATSAIAATPMMRKIDERDTW